MRGDGKGVGFFPFGDGAVEGGWYEEQRKVGKGHDMDDIVDRGYLRSRRKKEKTSGGGHGEGASVLLPEALEGGGTG